MADVYMYLQKVKQFCPHHVGHYLGMDVHDTSTISRNTKLLPGMVITSEPGKYCYLWREKNWLTL